VEPRVSFASPAFLVGLALIPVLLGLYVRAERRPQTFAPAQLLPSVIRDRPGWRRHAAVTGYGVALAALLVALAKPQATVAVPTEQARVMIVTDRSGSMLAEDVAPNRLAAAKKAAGTFLDAVPDEVRVGAVAFNQRAEVLQSPTRDHDAVREALQSVKAAGTTATGDAIEAALQSLRGDAPAAIVLLSDGKSVRGSDPLAAAQDARERKIPIYTVALGTAKGTINGGQRVPPDPETLAEIAERTGGRAFTAGNVDALDQVYERLGSQVATEKRKLEVTNLFAGGALALMALSALSSIRWLGRLL
jgi:Ca-activated chloride channel homolog